MKLTVRAVSPALTAVCLTMPGTVKLADGRELPARAGDWVITRGRIVVDLVGASQFAERYTVDDHTGLTLSATDRVAIERTTGLGSTRTAADLLKAVERLASIKVGTVQIDFTPGQLEEITQRATKRGRTVQQELQAVVDRIREEIFWRS